MCGNLIKACSVFTLAALILPLTDFIHIRQCVQMKIDVRSHAHVCFYGDCFRKPDAQPLDMLLILISGLFMLLHEKTCEKMCRSGMYPQASNWYTHDCSAKTLCHSMHART